MNKGDEMTTIGKRLRFIRENIIKYSRKDFVKDLVISTGSLENYENDDTSPDAAFLERLWLKYNKQLTLADFNWLLIGERKEEGRPGTDEYAHIPLYDVRAAAGSGTYVEAEEV